MEGMIYKLAYTGEQLDEALDKVEAVGAGKALASTEYVDGQAARRVPVERRVNGKELSSDVTLTADDVEAVPVARKINGKALTADLSLTASDVGARPDSWAPTKADVGLGSVPARYPLYVNHSADSVLNVPAGHWVITDTENKLGLCLVDSKVWSEGDSYKLIIAYPMDSSKRIIVARKVAGTWQGWEQITLAAKS